MSKVEAAYGSSAAPGTKRSPRAAKKGGPAKVSLLPANPEQRRTQRDEAAKINQLIQRKSQGGGLVADETDGGPSDATAAPQRSPTGGHDLRLPEIKSPRERSNGHWEAPAASDAPRAPGDRKPLKVSPRMRGSMRIGGVHFNKSDEPITPRRSRVAAGPNEPLANVSIDDHVDTKAFQTYLREALGKRATLAVDVFKDYDHGNGSINKKDFRTALKRLGLNPHLCPREQVDALFASWDADMSGSLDLAELRRVLRKAHSCTDGVMSDDAAAMLEAKAREAKRRAIKEQAAVRRQLQQAQQHAQEAQRGSAVQTKSVEDLYRNLGQHGREVLELFAQWDSDGDGVVTKPEFRYAMQMLGLQNERSIIDSLFELMDYDDSGEIALEELEQALAWARSKGRKGKLLTAKPVGSAVSEESRAAGGLLYAALVQNSTKVIELFRFLDQNEDGIVSKKEFRRAPSLLGIKLPAAEVDALFDSFDADGLGMLSFKELQKLLHHDIQLKRKSQKRAQQEEELVVADTVALRKFVTEGFAGIDEYIPQEKESKQRAAEEPEEEAES